MGVYVGWVPVGAFVALVLAIVIIIVAVIARRRGHIHNRHVLWIIAVVIFLLIIYGMGFGVMHPW